MDNRNDSFIFYRSFHEAIKNLDAETYGKVMFLICEYALNGVLPESIGQIENIVFTLIKPQIDANIKRRKVGQANGSKGGRPSKSNLENKNPLVIENKTNGFTEKNPNANANANANVNVNVNANANVDVNANVTPFTTTSHFPTLQDINDFKKENNLIFESEKFIEYYQKNNWCDKYGNGIDWKQSAISWNNSEFQQRKQNLRQQEKKQEEEESNIQYFDCPECNTHKLMWNDGLQKFKCKKCAYVCTYEYFDEWDRQRL